MSSYPSSSGSTVLPEASRWPSVIGIIGIVFGILGLLGGCIGTVSVFAMDFIRDVMDQAGIDTSQLDNIADNQALYAGIAIGAFVLALILLLAGISTLRRRGSSLALTTSWALLKIALVLGKAPLDYKNAKDSLAAMEEQSAASGTPISMGGMGDVASLLTVVLTVLWGVALPIFMLIWVARPKIRREMKSW